MIGYENSYDLEYLNIWKTTYYKFKKANIHVYIDFYFLKNMWIYLHVYLDNGIGF